MGSAYKSVRFVEHRREKRAALHGLTMAKRAYCNPARDMLLFWQVNRLTRQEQLVLCLVVGLLLLGWAVKAYRQAHPPAYVVQPVKL